MRASIKSQISPPVQQKAYEFSPQQVKTPNKAVDSTVEEKTNFKDLILNSNAAIKEEREAKKSGDYSNLSEEEFLKRLQEDSKPKRTPKNNLDKNDFLKLFVTQLQHQDPLNPDDGAAMASKLAQFNSLEQAMNTNTKLTKLIEAQGSSESHQLINYIGKEVSIEGGHLKIAGGQVSKPNFNLDQDAAGISLVVRDRNGIAVSETELGSMQRGTHQLNWDGKNQEGKQIPNGVYRFYLKARTLNDEMMDLPLSTTTKITGVDLQDKGKLLYTEFGKKPFSGLTSIGDRDYKKQIKQPQVIPPGAQLPTNASATTGKITPNKKPAGTTETPTETQGGAVQSAKKPQAIPQRTAPIMPASAAAPNLPQNQLGKPKIPQQAAVGQGVRRMP